MTDKEPSERTPRGHKMTGGTPMGRFGEPELLFAKGSASSAEKD
jgi:hypothetical protein